MRVLRVVLRRVERKSVDDAGVVVRLGRDSLEKRGREELARCLVELFPRRKDLLAGERRLLDVLDGRLGLLMDGKRDVKNERAAGRQKTGFLSSDR